MKHRADRQEDALAEERSRMAAEGERLARETKHGYAAKRLAERRTEAAAALKKARAIMASCEKRTPKDPGYIRDLSKAARGFDAYLDLHPNDVLVLIERARANELRSLTQEAIADLEHAIREKKELESELLPKIEALRKKIR
jgi:hypothetical protein